MCKLFSSYIFIVLPFRVEKRDCLHVKVLENFKCFCFNDKQKIITKGYEKSCKVGPNHAWYQSYLPNQFVGLQMASLEFLGFHVFPTLSPLCEVLWLGPDQQWSFGEPKRRWWSSLDNKEHLILNWLQKKKQILLRKCLNEKEKQTLNWGCLESAANVRITAWVLISFQFLVFPFWFVGGWQFSQSYANPSNTPACQIDVGCSGSDWGTIWHRIQFGTGPIWQQECKRVNLAPRV